MEEYDAESLDRGAVNGPIEIEVFSAMSGSLHCKIQWPETGLRQSTDFLKDLTHRLPQGVPCKVTAWWFQLDAAGGAGQQDRSDVMKIRIKGESQKIPKKHLAW